MTTSYVNFDGLTMPESGAPTVWKSTTGAGQILTATAGANNQLSDDYGGAPTLIGAGGDDTFNIVDPNTQVVETASTGTDTVNVWCNFDLPTNVNNLNLETASTIGMGNSQADLMIALAAHDTLIAGTGEDVLVDGGSGGETFTFGVNSHHDAIVGFQASGADHDTINLTAFGYTSFAQIQANLTQVGADALLTLPDSAEILIRAVKVSALTASDFDLPTARMHPYSAYDNYSGQVMYLSGASTVTMTATRAGQSLTGVAGAFNQIIDLAGGAPTLTGGGTGDDKFYINAANAKIIEPINAGIDTVYAWCSYVMGADLRNLYLESANATGSANGLGDLIIASAAKDTLVGGTGMDVLVDGGPGADTFSFNTAGDHDVVYGFQAAGANHDMLDVANFGYSSFSQVQSHLSQSGADTLLALSATDTVLIRNTVASSLSAADFTLAAPPVTVHPTGGVPSAYMDFSGQAMNLSSTPTAWLSTTAAGQKLIAGSAATGLGDQYGGAPTMIGGAGNDTFDILDCATTITAPSDPGVDTVNAWCDYVLPANVQNLNIELPHDTGVANSMGDLLIAYGQNDTLVGGAGSDVLVDAGAGSDVFSFGAGGGHDVIYGFQTSGANHDFIQLTNYGFTSFSQVQSHLSQVGADTLLSLSPTDAILIRNTQESSLNANDFLLQINTSDMTMTFDGEFNSLSVWNPATGEGVWKTAYQRAGVPLESGADAYTDRTLVNNHEQEIYVDPNYAGTGGAALGLNPFSISDGVLTITGAKAPTADVSALSGYQYTSGVLTTQESFAQTYGYFEIKAELPTGQGVWPAFWMVPADGSWPPELDVLESIGGDKIYQTDHTSETGTPTSTEFTTNLSNVSSGFHTYGVLWTPTVLEYFIDGVAVAETATPTDMNKPMYMIVNMALGGGWPGDVSSNFTSAQMKVAYVHAYSLDSVAASTVAAGSTVYVAQGSADTVPATADTVQSNYSFSLLGTSAHNLDLTGSGNINATANNLGDTLTGNAGNDILTGGTGNDTFNAGVGNDTMIAGPGTDTFIFSVGAGHDVINGFAGHDVLDISSYLKAGYSPTLADSGANVTLSFSTGTTIELLGIHASQLVASGVGYTL